MQFPKILTLKFCKLYSDEEKILRYFYKNHKIFSKSEASCCPRNDSTRNCVATFAYVSYLIDRRTTSTHVHFQYTNSPHPEIALPR